MKVDHLSTYPTGGAANAARRLHEALLADGIDSRFWSKPQRQQTPTAGSSSDVLTWPPEGSHLQRWLRTATQVGRKLQLKLEYQWSLAGRPSELEVFTSPRRELPTPYGASRLSGDVLHLHWISKLVDYASFFASIPGSKPIVWTLHDMNPFTGGCHFSGGCSNFVHQCDDCPQLGRRGKHDLSHRYFTVKQRAAAGLNLHVVAPSRWLEREARRSTLLAGARSFRTIHYGLDTQVFEPQDPRTARRELGLPENRVIVGYGAASLGVRRKGACEFLQAMRLLKGQQDLICLSFGSGNLPNDDSLPEFRQAGFVVEPTKLALLYSAMDLFVLPSLEDNSPQTGLEALACGTPVVAFDAGGISDFVRHGESGLLAPVGKAADLARQIQELAAAPRQREFLGRGGRQVVLKHFEVQRQTQAYVDLYEEVGSQRATSHAHAA
jgi:glycosyltransferase involved in cell wall biosynthesis